MVSAREGFNFLGHRIRTRRSPTGKWVCYQWPTPQAQQRLRDRWRAILHTQRAARADPGIPLLNPVTRGWAVYFWLRHAGPRSRPSPPSGTRSGPKATRPVHRRHWPDRTSNGYWRYGYRHRGPHLPTQVHGAGGICHRPGGTSGGWTASRRVASARSAPSSTFWLFVPRV